MYMYPFCIKHLLQYLGDFGPEYSLHQENVGLHKRNNNVDEELEAICETIRGAWSHTHCKARGWGIKMHPCEI